jgi:hypothetical protein
MAPFRFLPNLKRKIKRRVGYESDLGRLFRHGLPRPGGCFVLILVAILLKAAAAAAIIDFLFW